VRFQFIDEHQKEFAVKHLCDLLEVSRSGYYAWIDRPVCARARRRKELAEKIVDAHGQSRQLYGSPRVYQALLKQGEKVSLNTVAGIMKESGIRSKIHRKFKVTTTDSRHDNPIAPNTLERQFQADRPNQKWCVDITYVATGEGWLYLAGVIDLFSRRIVGWSMKDHLQSDLCEEALRMALARRSPAKGLLHHSDRGVQYTSSDYRHLLQLHDISVSMSRTGDCYDNAVMESFWGTLKTELIYHQTYATQDQAKRAIFEYIEVFYNRIRLHSSLGYQSPETFEAALN
jgi:transposase InsO family protein